MSPPLVEDSRPHFRRRPLFRRDSRPLFRRPVLVPGDADGNGTVEFSDLLTLSQNYGKAGTWTQGDFNGDGKVGFDDLLGLAQNYGHTLSPAASAVPEPAAILSILAAPLSLSRRRR